ncbi:MAG TPA: TlpA disulfide reductase family protein, partial [Burkholderiaceae bacterium]|nr:TlpA disulfide reductase family protein [Burkholderiaceae bacterium]
ARITAFLQKMKLTLPVVRDTDGSVARRWGARIFPANYLVDRSGNVRHFISGAADWTSPPLVSTIRALLTAQPKR